MILVFSLRETILVEAGKFMAPEASQIEEIADVVILEGTEFIGKSMVSKGLEMLSSGRARRMVIVLHRISPNHRPFAMQEDYPSSVKTELQKSRFEGFGFHRNGNPFEGSSYVDICKSCVRDPCQRWR